MRFIAYSTTAKTNGHHKLILLKRSTSVCFNKKATLLTSLKQSEVDWINIKARLTFVSARRALRDEAVKFEKSNQSLVRRKYRV